MANVVQNRVLYLQYTNPAHLPPLEHSSRILAGRNWSVLFLGIRRGADPVVLAPHPNIRVLELPGWPPGWRQKLHYVGFFFWAAAWVLAWKPRWVYASDPISCPIALALTWFPGIQVLYQEHDSPNTGSVPGVFLAARRLLARRAAVCVLPNKERADRFQASVNPRRLFCVWNCPPVAEVSAERAPIPRRPLQIYYHGSLNPERLPLSVIRAVGALSKRVCLLIAGLEPVGAKGYCQMLQGEARKAGIPEMVEIAGTVAGREELRSLMSRCDVGLTLVPASHQDLNLMSLVGSSSKVFEYLGAGMALLVPNRPEWEEAFVRPGYGLSCDPADPESIRRALEWFLEHPEETRRMGEKGRRMVLAEWNCERQLFPVVQVLEGAKVG